MSDQTKPNLKIVAADDDAEDVTPETPIIREMRSFTDGEGRTVMGEYPLEGGDPAFTGVFTVATNVGPMRMQMEFPVGMSIKECFDQFDGFAQETIRKAQEEQNDRNRIVTPDMMRRNAPKIVTP